MIGQSFAIIAVMLVMVFMFLRADRRAGAVFTLPLISVPIFHLLGFAFYKLLSFIPAQTLHIAFDVFGLILGLACCGILARAINVKKLRYVYFVSCMVFLAALCAAYVSYHI